MLKNPLHKLSYFIGKRFLSISLAAIIMYVPSFDWEGIGFEDCGNLLMAQNVFHQSDVQWVAIPNHVNWLYQVGEKASIEVQVLEHGVPQDDIEIRYRLAQDCLSSDTEGTVVTREGKAVIPVGTMKQPGFRDCVMVCTLHGRTYQNHLKVGFSPELLKPFTRTPKDFDSFWKKILDEQSQLPLQCEVFPASEYATDKVDCYKFKLRCHSKDDSHYIYGYLTRPKKPGKYPIVISPPGAGVKPMNPNKTLFYAEQGFVRLDLEIHGIDPALSAEIYKDITRAFGDHHSNGYLANGIYSRDTYYLKKVYAALVRAVDYAVTLPEWDGRNLFIQGASQGGALGIVLAALDPRITAACINHPALSDMAAYAEKGKTGGYPHFGRKYKNVSLTEEVIHTLSYYDVVSFAPRVKCPIYMTWGFNDNVCPPTTSYVVWNLLQCPKESLITPINEHWVSMETRKAQLEWLKRQMR